MFWVCGETYSGSGRMSRTWIEESGSRPDAEQSCDPSCMIYKQRGSGSCGGSGGCIPYPYNEMGGHVYGGYATEIEAKAAEAQLLN